jgi:hypothetical protein
MRWTGITYPPSHVAKEKHVKRPKAERKADFRRQKAEVASGPAPFIPA